MTNPLDVRPFAKVTLAELLGESQTLREQSRAMEKRSEEVEQEIAKRFKQSRDADKRRPGE